MGGSGSKAKGVWPFSGSGGGGDSGNEGNEQSLARLKGSRNATPFVFTRRSSLYYDEDGDLAHEFYEETVVTKNGRKKSKLKRIQKNLIPQGIVKLDHPCIHVDFPIVLCEVWKVAQDWSTMMSSCRYSAGSKVLFHSRVSRSRVELWSGRKKENSNCHHKLIYWMKCYTFGFNYGQWVPCSLISIFWHWSSVGTGCVSTTQLICKQSLRIHQVELYFSCEVCLQRKTFFDVKRL